MKVLAATKKENYLKAYNRAGAEQGWHFLVGEEDEIQALCDAVGFGFRYDPTSDEFAHGSGILIATADGVISRALPGIVYEARDPRLSLVEASRKQIGTPQPLSTGDKILADEDYVRESILIPQAKLVEGYPKIMPSYKGMVTENQISSLIAYLKSIGGSENGKQDAGDEVPNAGSADASPAPDQDGVLVGQL